MGVINITASQIFVNENVRNYVAIPSAEISYFPIHSPFCTCRSSDIREVALNLHPLPPRGRSGRRNHADAVRDDPHPDGALRTPGGYGPMPVRRAGVTVLDAGLPLHRAPAKPQV